MAGAATTLVKPPQIGPSDRLLRSSVYCRAEAGAGKKAPNGEAYDVRIVASTARVARDGGIIEAKAWAKDLSRYIANPVVQWCHDYSEPPVGTCVYVIVDEARGLLDAYWRFLTDISDDEWDRFAGRLKALYAVKGLNACSVGFIVHEWRDPTAEEKVAALQLDGTEPYWVAVRAELLEQSAVPVPSDPNALAVDRALGDAKRKGIPVAELEERWARAKQRSQDADAGSETTTDAETAAVDTPAEASETPAEPGRGADVTVDADALAPIAEAVRGVAEQLTAFRGEVDALTVRLAALEASRAAAAPADDDVEARVNRWLAEGARATDTLPPVVPGAVDHRAITASIARAFDARLTPQIDRMLQRRLGLPQPSTH